MEIILINHAEREHHPDPNIDRQIDRQQPLVDAGQQQAHDLANRLRIKGVTLYLTSRNLHAKQTAEIVWADLGRDPSVAIVEIDALTPFHQTESFEEIIGQATQSGHDPRLHEVIAVIGHYPRLNQLFAYLTGQTAAGRRLNYAQEVCLTAPSFEDFRAGNSKGQWP